MQFLSKYRFLFLFLIIALGLFLRIEYSRHATIYRDEALFLTLVEDKEHFPDNLRGTPFQGVPPLIVILGKAGDALFDSPRTFILAAQYVSSVLLILLFYNICCLLFDEHVVGLCGALLASTFYRFVECGGCAMRDGFYITSVAGVLYFALLQRKRASIKRILSWIGAFSCAAFGTICRREGIEEFVFLVIFAVVEAIYERKLLAIKTAIAGMISYSVFVAITCWIASAYCNYNWNPARGLFLRADWIYRNHIQ